MRTCDACGAGIPEDAAFCPGCGRAQQGPEDAGGQAVPDTPPEARSSMRGRILVTVAVLALTALVVGTATFFLSGRTVRGAVVSLTTGEPIVGATIASAEGTATTDGSGYFALPKLRLGTQVVTVTVDGFPPFETKVPVRALGTTEARLKLPDASVRVTLEEIALQPRAVDDAQVTVGGAPASRAGTGTFELKGLKPLSADIVVTAEGHETTKATLPLEPGVNDIAVKLRLTPAETYTRYFAAYRASRWQEAYAYFHPDVKKVESLEAFRTDSKMWGTPDEMAVLGTRPLPKWTSPATSASYTGVAEVRRRLTGKGRAGRYDNTGSSYWVDVDGVWLRVDI